MFFEGAEKKIEVVTSKDIGSLRAFGLSFWKSMVGHAQAEIISSVQNNHCDAYILSESSLFVWDNKFLLITCGGTTLINSVLAFIERVSASKIELLTYQRKSEFCSHLQPTSFIEDIECLRRLISGTAYLIGELNTHHHYLFVSNHQDIFVQEDSAIELLMYHMEGEITDYLQSPVQISSEIRERLKLNELFSGFIIDDFVFDPNGYSVNGISDDKYFTIHITPHMPVCYTSVETNVNFQKFQTDLIGMYLDIFKPRSWDLITFNVNDKYINDKIGWCISESHLANLPVYDVKYRHFLSSKKQILIPNAL